MSKKRLYFMGLFTLLMAPIGWALAIFPPLEQFLELSSFSLSWTIIGLEFGIAYAFLIIILTSGKKAQDSFGHQIRLIKSLNLSFMDCVFLSMCAGFGEELLFRAGVQLYLPPYLTSILFVAIHGYLLPRDWDTTKFGLVVLGMILVISYAKEASPGLWFGIAAHFAYDFILFNHWRTNHSIT